MRDMETVMTEELKLQQDQGQGGGSLEVVLFKLHHFTDEDLETPSG